MKNLILTISLLICQFVNSQFMTIHKNDGTTVVIQLSQIDSITYSNTAVQNAIVSNPGNPVVFDGYTYSTIVLGNGQQWMTENLKSSHYANGDSIPYVTDSSIWNNLVSGAQTHYNNNPQLETMGKLYNFYTISDTRNVCPTGWHVPSASEFDALINYLGGDQIAGGSLKSNNHWQLPNTGASNLIGFAGLPAGYRYSHAFSHLYQHGGFWTSSEDGTTSAWTRDIHYDSETVTNGHCGKDGGLSIRCIKD